MSGSHDPESGATINVDGAEVHVDVPLASALVADQFPQWAGLPVRSVTSSGTDHWMFRLGDDLTVRLPRAPWVVRTLLVEREWLPRVAVRLPVRTPVPVGAGEPALGYPWPWTVARWVDGTSPAVGGLADPTGLARDLAEVILALREVDPTGAPTTVWPAPLREEDARVAALLDRFADLPDPGPIREAWALAAQAPPCTQTTWIHGDLSPANLVIRNGRLHGVIDFSSMGRGDPASDLRPGWNLLPTRARAVLRERTGADDAAWARARGWVLLQALTQLDGFRNRNPTLASNARRVLDQVATEVRRGL